MDNNNVWTLTTLPAGSRPLTGKWVFKLKRGADGAVLRFKARFVVRGFEQEYGINFHDTFASVVKSMTYKALFAIAASLDWEVEQMDVKTAFLYGKVDEQIYVRQPHGFESGEGYCLLNRALYGLKQAPRVWYNTLSTFLVSLGFSMLDSNFSVFYKGRLFVAIYVDDLLLIGPEIIEINLLKAALHKRFQMADLGPAKFYLGMSLHRDRQNRSITINQTA